MYRLIIEQDIRPLSELRLKAAACIKQVHETKRPLIITQHGKGVGVLLDVAEFEIMQETIALWEEIHLATAQIEAGEGIDHQQAKLNILQSFEKCN